MFRIGWATKAFVSDKPVLLDGQFGDRVSTHVEDPITLTALALEGEWVRGVPEQTIIISCDLVSVSEILLGRIREGLAKRLPGFNTKKLIANATHTHTGPALREGRYRDRGPDVATARECADSVVHAAVDAAVEAWANLEPGGISSALGHAVVGHNRRAVFLDGSAKMYGDTNDENFASIEGFEDHTVDMLFTWDADRKLTGVVINLACPAQVSEAAKYISADFWHEVRTEIRKRLSPDLFILPQCAAAGDQSPHLLLHKQAERRMRELRGLTERQEIGRRIANAVEAALEVVSKDIRIAPIFKHIIEDIALPARSITEEEVAEARKAYEELRQKKEASPDDFSSSQHTCLNRNKGIIERCEKQKTDPTFNMELHVVRLGDLALATNPFELFLDFGLRIKARSQAQQTFIVQLACGRGVYLPTQKAISGKHYGAGAADNFVGPDGGQLLVNRTVELIEKLWDC